MAALNHIHTYVLYKVNRSTIKMQNGEVLYKCADPRCTHFAPYSAVIDKMSKCSKCGQTEIILTRDVLRHRSKIYPYTARPVGPCCSKSKEATQARNIRNILDATLGESVSQVG